MPARRSRCMRADRGSLLGPFQDFFEFLLGPWRILLMKEAQGFIVDFELGLDARVPIRLHRAGGGGAVNSSLRT